MKRYFTLLTILMTILLLQVNSCAQNSAKNQNSPEAQQAEIMGKIVYSSVFKTY